ncbi:MAG: glutathione S-transferase [bacterium]|jgi:glutathione S-transferase
MIKIYGSALSSAGRCYITLEEAGVEYEQVPLDMKKKEHKSKEFLALNPSGKVPCLIDGEHTFFESMAISHYIADKYKPSLLGNTVEDRGYVQQWSYWSMLELQEPLIKAFIQLIFVPEDKRDTSVVEAALEKAKPLHEIIDRHLEGKSFFVGEELTVADINVASIINLNLAIKNDLSAFLNLSKWFKEVNQRPSFQKIAELKNFRK